jgi:lipoate-protein ligase B
MCVTFCNEMKQTQVWLLPCLDFQIVQALQIALVRHKIQDPHFPDFILLTSHPACYTLGRASTEAERSATYAYPAFPVERGGHLTFHHPEQVIVYPILRLPTPNVHAHLKRVLSWGQDALQALGVDVLPTGEGSGLWWQKQGSLLIYKVAAVGIAVKSWTTFHGLALNVAVEEALWTSLPEGIHPCALPNTTPLNIQTLAPHLTRLDLEDALINQLQKDSNLGHVTLNSIPTPLLNDEKYDLLQFILPK